MRDRSIEIHGTALGLLVKYWRIEMKREVICRVLIISMIYLFSVGRWGEVLNQFLCWWLIENWSSEIRNQTKFGRNREVQFLNNIKVYLVKKLYWSFSKNKHFSLKKGLTFSFRKVQTSIFSVIKVSIKSVFKLDLTFFLSCSFKAS
jgi:hypothetical protein